MVTMMVPVSAVVGAATVCIIVPVLKNRRHIMVVRSALLFVRARIYAWRHSLPYVEKGDQEGHDDMEEALGHGSEGRSR